MSHLAVSRKFSRLYRRERAGLALVGCALTVVLTISVMIFFFLDKLEREENQIDGVSLVKLVAEVPFDRLSSIRTHNTLKNVFYAHQRHNLHYIVLVDVAGSTVAQVKKAGLTIPDLNMGATPAQWSGERDYVLNDRQIHEFYAPIMQGSELVGFARVGYVQERGVNFLSNISFIAMVSLPVFLMAPMFYLLFRREIKPLVQAQDVISQQMGEIDGERAQLTATGELSEFIENFNSCFGQIKTRIDSLEVEKQQNQLSGKVLEYNFSRFENILDELPLAIIALDEQGTPFFANSKVESILGVSLDDVLNEPPESWACDEKFRKFIRNCQRKGGLTPASAKIDSNVEEGPIYGIQSLPLSRETHNSRELAGCLIVVRDESEIAFAEKARQQFISHVSHELKTPLNTIGMYIEALLDMSKDDREFRADAFNVVHDEVERMNDLISNLMSITQLETGSLKIERHRVKTEEFIKDIYENIKNSNRAKNIHFQLEIANTISPVAIDKSLMRIAINNLLTNAVKYSDDNGKVLLKVEEIDDRIKISVEDNGIGISEEDQNKVFNKFFRSENDQVRDRSGHGLGLSLTSDIVNLHNGRLTVHSKLNEGSVFTLEFAKEENLLKWAS